MFGKPIQKSIGRHIELYGFNALCGMIQSVGIFKMQHQFYLFNFPGICKNIGFVFQFHHLLSDLSALENVMMPAACAAGRETRAMRERAAELLGAVGLSHRRDYRPSEMSGGQRQRVAVARALINNPVLVLADEPTGNLDRQSADHVMDLIRSINQTMATSFLISTHDEYIAGQCPRRIELLDGRIVRS